MKDVDEKVAEYLDLPVAEGVVVTDLAKDSPADKMGLKKYDIIREMNGQKVNKSSEIQNMVQGLKPGDRVNLKIYRGGKTQIISGKLGQKP